MLLVKTTVVLLLSFAAYGAALFLPAGTIGWWRGWVFLGVLFPASLGMAVWLYRNDKALLEERMRTSVQRGQPLADKILVSLLRLFVLAWFIFIPAEVFRLQWGTRPSVVASSVGLVLVTVGLWLFFLTLRANSFAVPVVKHQEARQQRVIDTGVYGVVRHPMYAGLVLLFVGTPLWLESYGATALAFVLIGLLVVRILVEERFLERELAGYTTYKERVRYRLVPYVW